MLACGLLVLFFSQHVPLVSAAPFVENKNYNV
jgi:hypothetical protein